MGMHANPATSSGLLNSNTAISAKPCQLHALQVISDGTNQATVTLYDNASTNSGRELAKILVKAGDSYNWFQSMCGVEANNGIYAEVAGTGAMYIVHFSPQ